MPLFYLIHSHPTVLTFYLIFFNWCWGPLRHCMRYRTIQINFTVRWHKKNTRPFHCSITSIFYISTVNVLQLREQISMFCVFRVDNTVRILGEKLKRIICTKNMMLALSLQTCWVCRLHFTFCKSYVVTHHVCNGWSEIFLSTVRGHNSSKNGKEIKLSLWLLDGWKTRWKKITEVEWLLFFFFPVHDLTTGADWRKENVGDAGVIHKRQCNVK